MRCEDVDFMIEFLYRRCGLVLAREQEYLLESRLLRIAREHGGSLAALIDRLRADPASPLAAEVTEAMTTNETSFFRDGRPFDHLHRIVLPELRRQAGSRRTLRIWSAACSTGQEPYSLAMLLLEDQARYPEWQYDIVATDFSEKVIEQARQGIYSQFEAQRGMAIHRLLGYFRQQPDKSWQACESLRAMVRFSVHNLLKDAPPPGRFDLILCRNVLMYFDEASRAQVMARLCDALQPDGYIMLGTTESLSDPHHRLTQPEGLRGIYRQAHHPAPRAARRHS